MNYHNITKDDMLNGDGLRAVLWVSGCTHCCDGCQNPETWEVSSGIEFDAEAEKELFEAMERDNWMDPKDAKEFGLIDGILERK